MGKFIEKFCITHQFYMVAGIASAGIVSMLLLGFYLFDSQIGTAGAMTAMTTFAVIAIVVIAGFAHYLGVFNGKRAEVVVGAMSKMAKGDLTKKIDIRGKDEYAWMCWEYTCSRKGFKEMIENVIANSAQLASAAEELSTITVQSSEGVSRQQNETQQVATAMNEMSATVHEVAKNAAKAATAAHDADEQAKDGYKVVRKTVDTPLRRRTKRQISPSPKKRMNNFSASPTRLGGLTPGTVGRGPRRISMKRAIPR